MERSLKLLAFGGLSLDSFVQYFYLVFYCGLSYVIFFSPVVVYVFIACSCCIFIQIQPINQNLI